MKDQIISLSKDFFTAAVQIRRHLHMYPELSFQEYNTSDFVISKLNEFAIPFKKGFAKTGIIGKIEGKNPGKKIIALRADMDALPVMEKNDLPYKSKNEGIMHACGHDIHMTCLLGAAKILNNIRDQFEGTVLLIFQPGEELLPGGAKMMLDEGALDNPKPDAVLALHVQPDIPTGVVGFRSGKYMASSDEIYIRVKGKGGHGAMPHEVIDPVLIASHLIVSLQQIVSRNTNVSIPTVLSFGKIIANGATNIVPDEVRLEGTFRTTDENWRKAAHEKIVSISRATAESMGAICDIEIRKGYPVLFNDPNLNKKLKEFAREYLGKDKIEKLDIRMTSEDFAYFSEKFSSCFFRLGVASPDKHPATLLHNSNFMVDENAIETGTGLMAWLAWSLLNQ